MARIITDFLDESVKKYPEKTAVMDQNNEYTYLRLQEIAHRIASSLITKRITHQPVAVFCEQRAESLVSFFGIAYAGCYYTPIDTRMPLSRMNTIIDVLRPAVILSFYEYKETVEKIAEAQGVSVAYFEDLTEKTADQELISKCYAEIKESDLIYVLFTSGSTGIPKGVPIRHESLIDFTEWVTADFKMDEKDKLANQVPFFFDHSLTDVYGTIKSGATLCIVPRKVFSFPIRFLEYIRDNQVNMTVLVPTVMTQIAKLDLLSRCDVSCLKKVLYGGEAMPTPTLNYWHKMLPDTVFGNIYGPTEATGVCAYYILNRELDDSEPVPIGYPCRKEDVIVLNEQDQLVIGEEKGELCVRGIGVSTGYYHNEEKSKGAFVQNPLSDTEDRLYRTGDIVHYNTRGELIYDGRRDFQVKHFGHRIELGEIDVAVAAIAGIEMNCTLFDKEADQILLFYVGDIEARKVRENLLKKIPAYMMPNKYEKLNSMPLNQNGKIDRKKLQSDYQMRK